MHDELRDTYRTDTAPTRAGCLLLLGYLFGVAGVIVVVGTLLVVL